jgi:hypothetical protein
MSDNNVLYLKVTPKELFAIEKALETRESRRLAVRKSVNNKRLKEGGVESEVRIRSERIELKLVNPVDIAIEYRDRIPK